MIRGHRKKTLLIVYSFAIAVIAIGLQWFDYLHAVRGFSSEIYIGIIALTFTALGVWAGTKIMRPRKSESFEKNAKAMEYLGITSRECEVLELLAEGRSNQEIADTLYVSANTVKTHLAHLYDKLEVSRRTQAIRKARSLRLIP